MSVKITYHPALKPIIGIPEETDLHYNNSFFKKVRMTEGDNPEYIYYGNHVNGRFICIIGDKMYYSCTVEDVVENREDEVENREDELKNEDFPCGYGKMKQGTAGTCWFNAGINALFLPDAMRDVWTHIWNKKYNTKRIQFNNEYVRLGDIFDNIKYSQNFDELFSHCILPRMFLPYFLFILYSLFIRKIKNQGLEPYTGSAVSTIGAVLLESSFMRSIMDNILLDGKITITHGRIQPIQYMLAYLFQRTEVVNVPYFPNKKIDTFGISHPGITDIVVINMTLTYQPFELPIRRVIEIDNSNYDLVSCNIIAYRPNKKSGHAVCGFICENELFIYDSGTNTLFMEDWTKPFDKTREDGIFSHLTKSSYEIPTIYTLVYLRQNWKASASLNDGGAKRVPRKHKETRKK